MEEFDVEVVVQRALEKYPEAKPRIISDNGSRMYWRDEKSNGYGNEKKNYGGQKKTKGP